MAIDPTKFYSTLADANTFFAEYLHSKWSGKSDEDKEKALLAATRAIDKLSFNGYKKPVYDLLLSNPNATQAQIDAADATQLLQFPRDTQTVPPDNLLFAVYEEAHELIRGRRPNEEFDMAFATSTGAGTTRASYDRSELPDHVKHGIVSFKAWTYLLPFLDDNNTFTILRQS